MPSVPVETSPERESPCLRFVPHPGIRGIFVDIFDTIILRRVHPEHTKRLAAKRIAMALGGQIGADQIYQVRNRLERAACLENERTGYDQEFCFDATFTARWRDELRAAGVPRSRLPPAAEFHELCVDCEIDAELHVQTIDREIVAELRKAQERGIPIYAISDFYLPASALRRLLAAHGILSLFDDIIVSSEHRVTKRGGRLYRIALERVGIAPEHMIMIGDNEHSDVAVPKELGLHVHPIDRVSQRRFYEAAAALADHAHASQLVCTAVSELIARNDPSAFFPEFALTLYSFVEKLYMRLMADGVRDVFFLSREGEFLKLLFDLYQETNHFSGRNRVHTHYLLASRKATFVAALGPLQHESFEALFRQYRALSIGDFLANLGISDADAKATALEIGVDASRREPDLPQSDAFKRLKANATFQRAYEQVRSSQRALIHRYLDSFGVDIRKRGLHLVDVGWKGTIQDNLYRVLDGDVVIQGYYVGLIAKGAMSARNRKDGLLFSSIATESPFFAAFDDNRAVFEILLGASHGSANQYVERNGLVDVETLDRVEEHEIFTQLIQPIQRRYEMEFRRLAELFSRLHFTIEQFDELVARTHARFSFMPTDAELAFFAELHHYENFGAFGTTRFDHSHDVRLRDRVRNLRRLLSSPTKALATGWWPPLTLQQMGLSDLRQPWGHYRMHTTFKGARR